MVNFPTSLAQGETFRILGNYSGLISATCTILGPTKTENTADVVGSAYSLSLSTAAWTPGEYQFSVTVVNDEGNTIEATRQRFTLKASLASQTAGNRQKSQAETIVEAIDNHFASGFVENKSFKIAGRELEQHSANELLLIRDYYAAKVAKEIRKERGFSPLGAPVKARI
jgi:hypothetical protein